MIKVGIEESTLWDIMTKWWIIVIPSQQVVGIIYNTRLVRSGSC